jgi:tetratricopeptide (TPR) repeat protein
MPMPKRELFVSAVLALLLGTTEAFSQGAEEQARKDFEAGAAAEERGQWAEACRYYRAALDKLRVVGPLTGSARCDAREGRYLAAIAKVDAALATLPPDHPKRASYEADRAAWKAKLARLVVTLRPGATSSSVTLDGRSITPKRDPHELDPGKHVVRADGIDKALDLAEGSDTTVEVPFTAAAPPSIGTSPPTVAPEPDGTSPWLTAAIVSFSIGGAAIVATTVTGVMVLDRDSTAEELCTPTPKAGCDQAIDDGKALLAPNLAMWIVSGVAVAAGVTFVIVDATTGPASSTAAKAELRIGPGAIELSGSF